MNNLSNIERNYYNGSNVRNLSRRREVQSLRHKLHIMVIFCILCLTLTVMMFITYSKNAKEYINMAEKYEATLTDYLVLSDQYEKLYTEYEAMCEEYNSNIYYTKDCEEAITDLSILVDDLDKQSKSLVISNQNYYEQIQIYEQREELFDKYEYAIIRTDGTRTDITYDQLITLESLTQERDIDTDLILSITMVESDGVESARSSRSTASGYGQFIYGTGEFVYEDLMNAGTYKHEYALDGSTNFEMMVNYIDYLEDIHDNNLYAVIRNYRGKDGKILENYINKIDNFLKNKDKSVDQINNNRV